MHGNASPQRSHVSAAIRRMAARQVSQTGRREILSRGSPQRRQSDGKNAAKRPRAAELVPEAVERHNFRKDGSQNRRGSALEGGKTVERVMSPVLLKTNLPRQAPG